MAVVIIDDLNDLEDVVELMNYLARALASSNADRHEGPVRYVPCPGRGTYARLTECWMCWCDVHRGAASRGEVLAEEVMA